MTGHLINDELKAKQPGIHLYVYPYAKARFYMSVDIKFVYINVERHIFA